MAIRPILTLLLALLACGFYLHAEEQALSAEEEKKISDQEDAAGDENITNQQKTVFTGQVVLEDDGKANERGVIGVMACDDNKLYPIKVASEEVLTQLKEYNGKKATLAGKLRVNGKYLVVMAVVNSTPLLAPRDKRKRNGL